MNDQPFQQEYHIITIMKLLQCNEQSDKKWHMQDPLFLIMRSLEFLTCFSFNFMSFVYFYIFVILRILTPIATKKSRDYGFTRLCPMNLLK